MTELERQGAQARAAARVGPTPRNSVRGVCRVMVGSGMGGVSFPWDVALL